MSIAVRDFLKARRDRALGSILGHAERNVYPELTQEQRRDLRQVVVDALNSYHDSVLDLVKSADGVTNDILVDILEAVQDMESRLGTGYTYTTKEPISDPDDEHDEGDLQ